MKDGRQDRRALISGLGAAAAAVALGSSGTRAQTKAPFAPARHAQDAWLDELPGKHRVFIDSVSGNGASDALLYAGNLFTANKAGYGLDDGDLAIVVCFRHLSTSFAFGDAMWAKYGKPLAEAARYTSSGGANPPAANPQQKSIDALAKRGVQFAVCDMATHRVAGQIATAVGATADAIYKEITANAAPNSHFVAAGVVGATRAQEYGYSLLVAG
jgi:intracellular sulfur oxidation DsrE/DsrF family protein